MRTNAVTRILLLIIVLAMGTALVAACGGPDLEAAAEEGDVDALIEGLQSDNVEVRRDAALMLGGVGDQRAVPALINALEDNDEFVRALSASSLGDLGDERAIEPLRGALQDEDERVRDAAAASLNQLGAAAGN